MVLTAVDFLTEIPSGAMFIAAAWAVSIILIFWLVYKQMSASAKEGPESGYKMDSISKHLLLRISVFIGMIIILLIVSLLLSKS